MTAVMMAPGGLVPGPRLSTPHNGVVFAAARLASSVLQRYMTALPLVMNCYEMKMQRQIALSLIIPVVGVECEGGFRQKNPPMF